MGIVETNLTGVLVIPLHTDLVITYLTLLPIYKLEIEYFRNWEVCDDNLFFTMDQKEQKSLWKDRA